MRKCSTDGCEAVHYGKGYCRPHYRWFVEQGNKALPNESCVVCGGEIPVGKRRHAKFCGRPCQMKWHRQFGCYTPEALKKSIGVCGEPGCDREIRAHGMCNVHRLRVYKYGNPDAFFAKRVTGNCIEGGCGEPAIRKDRCKKHYQRWYLNEHRREIYVNNNVRRTRLAQATPPWVDMKEMKRVYMDCAHITAATGVEHHVDHIVPIKGRIVCGLHVPWNLRVLPAKLNRQKSNKHELQP